MIAHSLNNPVFGPAQSLHGATYIVDVTFYSEMVDRYNMVIDIAMASRMLKNILEKFQYKNLDDIPDFHGKLTTTEFLARYIHDVLKEKTAGKFNGRIGVTLGESHIAWASYEGEDDKA